jgi:histidinol-phosphatase
MATKQADWLALLVEISDRADAIARQYFRAPDLSVDQKTDASPVTIADRTIEQAARELMARRHPRLGVYGEEYGKAGGDDAVRLIIDPIDGTRNFVRGIPIFATLLAIEDRGEIVAGLVSAPALGLRWHAMRGGGAFCGTRRLHVSTVGLLSQAEVFHADLSGAAEAAPPPGIFALFARAHRTRGFGDFYQHLLVAEGAGEVAIDPVVKPWDIAALQVIIEEAGGRATSLAGTRSIYDGSLVSSNGLVHDEALKLLTHPGS